MPTRKIAIVHDWLWGRRGGEKVLEAILELYPTADLYTLFGSAKILAKPFDAKPVHPSFLHSFPLVEKYYRWLLPLFPTAVENFDLSAYDLILSSSHCAVKGIIPRPDALHICYCHSPMRYAWDQFEEYFGTSPIRPLLQWAMTYLRQWDAQSSNRVDHFIANSSWVANRIARYYRRESTVIHPFFDAQSFTVNESPREDFFLVVSALVPYKKIDLAIDACVQLNKKLVVVGDGPELPRLRRKASSLVDIRGNVSNEELRNLYGQAKALLFPGVEDFGIVPLEAMASGTPIIALERGGLLDSVVENQTGIFFSEPTVASLGAAILRFESMSFSPQICRKQAEQFSRAAFQEKLRTFVDEKLHNSKR